MRNRTRHSSNLLKEQLDVGKVVNGKNDVTERGAITNRARKRDE